MSVTLQNRTGRQFIFHLLHGAACSQTKCYCGRAVVGVQDHHPDGKRSVRAFKRRVPDSVTLNARRTEGDTVAGLPEGVLQVPEVVEAIRRNELAWAHDKEGTPPHHIAAKLAHAKHAAAQAALGAKTEAKAEEDRPTVIAPPPTPPPPEEPPAPAPVHPEIHDEPQAEAPKAEV